MNGFTIKNFQNTASFDDDELYLTIDEFGHIDVTVKTNR